MLTWSGAQFCFVIWGGCASSQAIHELWDSNVDAVRVSVIGKPEMTVLSESVSTSMRLALDLHRSGETVLSNLQAQTLHFGSMRVTLTLRTHHGTINLSVALNS